MSWSSTILKLYEIGSIKFGSFTLKSGITSPIYIDLRLCISYPKILRDLAYLIYKKSKSLDYKILCGVPYTALPIATAISLEQNIPMVLRRKEVKDYGTKKMLEGVFSKGDKCLIIEDIVTSGSSILETVLTLREEGLEITDAIVLIDREQGGEKALQDQNITLHSIYTLKEILQTLQNEQKLDPLTMQSVIEFLEKNQTQ